MEPRVGDKLYKRGLSTPSLGITEKYRKLMEEIRQLTFNSLSRDHMSPCRKTNRHIILSTPSLGITCRAHISSPDACTDFQLPLSGSPVVSRVCRHYRNLSTPSLGITYRHREFATQQKEVVDLSTPSLGITRNSIRFRLSVASASRLSTPSLGITFC